MALKITEKIINAALDLLGSLVVVLVFLFIYEFLIGVTGTKISIDRCPTVEKGLK